MDLVLSMLEVRFSDDVHIVTRTQYIGVKTKQKKARNFQLGQLLNKFLATLQLVVATLQVGKKQTTFTRLLKIETLSLVKAWLQTCESVWILLSFSFLFFLIWKFESCMHYNVQISICEFHRSLLP